MKKLKIFSVIFVLTLSLAFVLPNFAKAETGTTPPDTTSSSQCGGDSRLQSVNGICVPVSSYSKNSIAGSTKLMDVIFTLINYLLLLSGLIAVGALVLGGYWYITAAGNEEQGEKGKSAILNAIIGLVIIIMAYAIVNVVTSSLTTTNILSKSSS